MRQWPLQNGCAPARVCRPAAVAAGYAIPLNTVAPYPARSRGRAPPPAQSSAAPGRAARWHSSRRCWPASSPPRPRPLYSAWRAHRVPPRRAGPQRSRGQAWPSHKTARLVGNCPVPRSPWPYRQRAPRGLGHLQTRRRKSRRDQLRPRVGPGSPGPAAPWHPLATNKQARRL